MHSSALGTTERICLRSLSRAARFSPFTVARYSSMVVGFLGMGSVQVEDLFHVRPPVARSPVGAGELQRLGDVPPLAHARGGRQLLHALGELAVGAVVLEV